MVNDTSIEKHMFSLMIVCMLQPVCWIHGKMGNGNLGHGKMGNR